MNIRLRSTLPTLAFAAAVAAGAAATASPVDPAVRTFTETVSYPVSDLNTAAGAQRLASSIRAAAGRVCGAEDVLAPDAQQLAACRDRAIARAVSSVDAPGLKEALGFRTSQSQYVSGR